MFYRVVSEYFATGCSTLFSHKSSKYTKLSQLTHLMLIILFYTLFLGGIKKTSVMKCVDYFWSVKPFWILSGKKVTFFFIFVCRKFSWLCKNVCLWKTSLIKENFFFAENFSCLWEISLIIFFFFFFFQKTLWKISTTAEKFLDWGKVPWVWKVSMIVEKFLDCGKVSWPWRFPWPYEVLWLGKNSLTVEKFLDCGKVPWSRKISLFWLHKK